MSGAEAPDLGAIAVREAEMLRAYLLSRVQAGVDLRWLILAHSAQLGRMAAVCSQSGYLESTLDQMIATMRYNAILIGPVAGNA